MLKSHSHRGRETEQEMTKAISSYEEIELESAQCGCCGIWEECTIGYVNQVKQRYGGVWVCGLCEEAIKDQQVRLGGGATVEAALRSHATFIHEYSRGDPSIHDVNIARSLIQLVKKKKMIFHSARTSTSSSCCHVNSSS